MKILSLFFLTFIVFAEDFKGYVEVVNPNIKNSKELKEKFKGYKVKHITEHTKKKDLLPVKFRNRLIEDFELVNEFEERKFDELDKDNFFRIVEHYETKKVQEFYDFLSPLRIDEMKNVIGEYRNE